MDEDELKLAPVDEQTNIQRKLARQVPPYTEPPEDEKQPGSFQFSILQMMVATILVGLVTALCQWFSPNMIAGGLGLVTLFATITIMVFAKQRPVLNVVLFFMVLVYVIVAITTVLQG